MKVKVTITCDTDVKSFYVSCGRGDKTFKWLGLVVSQRYALAAPNGATRRRDSDIPHGISQHVQQLPFDMKSKNGEYLHPGVLISEMLKDGDEIFCTLGASLPVDPVGTPTMTNWASTAFLGIDNSSQQEDSHIQHDPSQDSSSGHHAAKAQFMKVILASQMYNDKAIEAKLDTAWDDVPLLLPRLSRDTSLQLRAIFRDYAIILFDIYAHYTADAPDRKMDYHSFQLFIENSEIFPQRDLLKLTKRIFQSTIQDSTTTAGSLSLPEFMVSLIYTSQLRYNDTLDANTLNLLWNRSSSSTLSPAKSSTSAAGAPVGGNSSSSTNTTVSQRSVDIVQVLFENHLISLAENLSLDCLIRLEFNSSQFLYQLKEYHHDLFHVFEFYSNKLARDLALTVTHVHLLEILYQSGLIDSYQETFQNVQMLRDQFLNFLTNPMTIGREKNDNATTTATVMDPSHDQSEEKIGTARDDYRLSSARDDRIGTAREGRMASAREEKSAKGLKSLLSN
jgi:hypothetical protein